MIAKGGSTHLEFALIKRIAIGTPDYAMKLKGVTYCHATAGNSSDKRIVMGYLYNPQKTGYSISFSYNGGGISYSPSGTAYTAYKTMNLSY